MTDHTLLAITADMVDRALEEMHPGWRLWDTDRRLKALGDMERALAAALRPRAEGRA
jgi:hypothetical protein